MIIEDVKNMRDIDLLKNNGVNIEQSLELFGDMETYDSTLEDFLETITQKLSEIQKYKEVTDMPNYAILVHSLKSDAKYLGFTKLAEISFAHEMHSKENDVMFIYEHYDELMNETDRILQLLGQYLGKEKVTSVVSSSKETIKDKKILVVDDSNVIRNLIQKIFDEEFEVIAAADGREALAFLESNPGVKLYGILLDLNMPNINGFTVLDYFKQNNLFAKIPVAIITGDDSKETALKAFTYPIVDVLTKPFNERDVKRVVTSMINFH